MISKLINGKWTLWLLLIAAFLVRTYNLSFPFFTSDEARIAYRGYTLSSAGKDELGRNLPFIFNALDDYQLPAVSYTTAIGIKLFGKNDFGVKIPFIIISLAIIFIIFHTAKIFNPKKEYQILSAFIIAFSPGLIFLSRIPNETILLIFGFSALLYILTKDKINLFKLSLAMIFSLTVSKIAWWLVIPFTVLTLFFFQNGLKKSKKIAISAMAIFFTSVIFFIFIFIPQSSRSLLENDLLLFKDPSLTPIINSFRGHGLTAGWPNFLEKIIFNKMHIINLGLINWFDYMSPSVFFSQIDSKSMRGFMNMGQFPSALLVPVLTGLFFIIKKGDAKLKALIYIILITSFPIFFTFPNDNKSISALSLPFIAFITAFGLLNANKKVKYLILIAAVLEVVINLIYNSPEVKNANQTRPAWIKIIAQDAYSLSSGSKVAVSDNLVSDVSSYIAWHSPILLGEEYKNINFPYKFRQTQIDNIRILGTEDTFYFCGLDKPTSVIASKRDLEKIQRWLNINTEKTVQKIYEDALNNKIAYLLKPTICVH